MVPEILRTREKMPLAMTTCSSGSACIAARLLGDPMIPKDVKRSVRRKTSIPTVTVSFTPANQKNATAKMPNPTTTRVIGLIVSARRPAITTVIP